MSESTATLMRNYWTGQVEGLLTILAAPGLVREPAVSSGSIKEVLEEVIPKKQLQLKQLVCVCRVSFHASVIDSCDRKPSMAKRPWARLRYDVLRSELS